MGVGGKDLKGMVWIDLAQDMNEWQVLACMILNCGVGETCILHDHIV